MIRILNKNFMILLAMFIGASVARCALDKNEYINNIVAFINIASLLLVCYMILEKAGEHLVKLIDNNKFLGEKIKNKKKTNFKKTINVIFVILLICGVGYALFFSGAIRNDIVGFGALFLSIETDYISESIGIMFYKKK